MLWYFLTLEICIRKAESTRLCIHNVFLQFNLSNSVQPYLGPFSTELSLQIAKNRQFTRSLMCRGLQIVLPHLVLQRMGWMETLVQKYHVLTTLDNMQSHNSGRQFSSDISSVQFQTFCFKRYLVFTKDTRNKIIKDCENNV